MAHPLTARSRGARAPRVGGLGAQVLLHCAIVYTPQLAAIFNLRPLRLDDWRVVLAWSLPVVLLDEALKLVQRKRARHSAARV